MNPHVARKVAALMAGRTIVSRESGNSMLPLIRSGQPVRIRPVMTAQDARAAGILEYVDPSELRVGDVVLVKVRGSVMTHLIDAVRRGSDGDTEWQISNLRGHVNGWSRTVYGKVVEIL